MLRVTYNVQIIEIQRDAINSLSLTGQKEGVSRDFLEEV